jgi:predicted O-linked N-acetylglucosamine transferase (SPINDLY family)
MHDPGASAETIFAEHRRFGEALDASLRAPAPRHTHDRNPERPLRIGLCPATCASTAAHFMEPMFEALGQRGLSLVAYSNLTREDGTSARLRGLIPTWHRVAALSDTELAALIRADRIDILVDLFRHTADNRLPVFALRPAPVQVTWLGYRAPPACAASTTASSTLTAPPGLLDDQFSRSWCTCPTP